MKKGSEGGFLIPNQNLEYFTACAKDPTLELVPTGEEYYYEGIKTITMYAFAKKGQT